MEFKVTSSTQDNVQETRNLTQFPDVMQYISEKTAAWNNFHPEEPIYFEISKVDDGTDTLGVSVDDVFKISDIFGRQ